MSLREEMAEAGEPTEAVDNQLAEYVKREVKKVDNIRGYLRHCEMMQAAAAEEVKRLSALAHSWKQRRERLMGCCRITMEAVGAKRIEGQTGSLSLKGNGGPAPLEITDEGLVPSELCDVAFTIRGDQWEAFLESTSDDGGMILAEAIMQNHPKRTPNNTRIRESISRGEPVPGARLGERGAHIEIR